MGLFIVIVNYFAWFIFTFAGVVWLLVLLENRGKISYSKKAKKFPSVTVLVPAYNEEKTIAKTIKSLLSLDYPKHLLEIIVINDCSKDMTKQIVSKFKKHGIVLLNNLVNSGKAFSMNRGIEAARGEMVACLDADSTVHPKALKRMVGYFDDKEIAAVTPAMKIIKPKKIVERIQVVEYILNIFLRRILSFMDSIHVTPGVFTVYRKSVLKEIGGFDVGNLTEDMEIALKIHKAGYKIENNINAISYTICPSTWKALFKQRTRWYRGAIHNSFKYRHMFFNTKYGNLGVFMMPMVIISFLSIAIIFAVLMFGYLTLFLDFLHKMALINWDVFSTVSGGFDVGTFFYYLLSTPFMFMTVGILLGALVLLKSFKFTNNRVRYNKSSFVLFLFVYPFITMAFWCSAIFHELFRFKKNW